MGGFRDESNNIAFEIGIFNLIIEHIYNCCKKMRQDCIDSGNLLINHEDRITDRLVASYLDDNNLGFSFIPQSPESFNQEEDRFLGRCDIKVISRNYFIDRKDYFLIECKRIDGHSDLNRQYVSKGIARFVMEPVKYPSYHKLNIMLGYIVEPIDIPKNLKKIETLQKNLLTNVQTEEFVFVFKDDTDFYHYGCTYRSSMIGTLRLAHLFYDCSMIVKDA